MNPLAGAVVAVVAELGDAHVRTLASAYRSTAFYDAASAAADADRFAAARSRACGRPREFSTVGGVRIRRQAQGRMRWAIE